MSPWSIVSEKITKGSRIKRCDICLDSRSSSPEKFLDMKNNKFAMTDHDCAFGRIIVDRMAEDYRYTLDG